MAKKIITKALSVGLSLAMCAGMVVPAFAASFSDLNNAINSGVSTGFYTTDNGIRYGYGQSMGENKWEIEAWDADGTRNVQLNEDVTYGGERDIQGITTKANSKVTLNLNGKTIDGGYDAETGEGGSGKSIITMGPRSTLTINGGADSGDTTKRGTITGGRSNGDGGAITAKSIARLTVNNVDFIGNRAGGDGGAISTYYSTIELNNIIMTENCADTGSGGAVWAGAGAKVTMTGDNIVVNNSAVVGIDDIFQYHGKMNSAAITGAPEQVTYKGITYYKETVGMTNGTVDYEGVYDNYDGTMINYVHRCISGDPVRENVVGSQVGVPGSYDLVVRCPECGEIISSTHVIIPALPGGNGGNPSGTDTPDGGTDTATAIDDEDVPLAGIYTRADAIGYLWEQAGSPEAELSDFADVPEDHQWAVAIGWAQDMGIALADEDGNFRPDDLVLRSTGDIEGELQEFLNRYAVFAGVELADGELFIELEGEPSDVIMGEEAQVIFDGFFEKLEAALAEKAA